MDFAPLPFAIASDQGFWRDTLTSSEATGSGPVARALLDVTRGPSRAAEHGGFIDWLDPIVY